LRFLISGDDNESTGGILEPQEHLPGDPNKQEEPTSGSEESGSDDSTSQPPVNGNSTGLNDCQQTLAKTFEEAERPSAAGEATEPKVHDVVSPGESAIASKKHVK
jgi:hypothetical protein